MAKWSVFFQDGTSYPHIIEAAAFRFGHGGLFFYNVTPEEPHAFVPSSLVVVRVDEQAPAKPRKAAPDA